MLIVEVGDTFHGGNVVIEDRLRAGIIARHPFLAAGSDASVQYTATLAVVTAGWTGPAECLLEGVGGGCADASQESLEERSDEICAAASPSLEEGVHVVGDGADG